MSALLITVKPFTVLITRNWKIVKEIGYQTTLPASWETCVQVKKQQLEPEQLTGSKLGKKLQQGYILSPCLFKLYAEYIMWNARPDESQTGIKIARKNINNLRCEDDTTLNSGKWREKI